MGTISEKLTYLNNTKGLLKDNINLTGAGLTNQTPFRQYATDLKTALLNILNNGIDSLYNNFPKTTGTGTNISLNNTLQAPIRSVINGDTEQDGTPTPDNPKEIKSVTGLQKVGVCGKNLINTVGYNKGTNESGTITTNVNYLGINDYVKVKPNTTYAITFQDDVSGATLFLSSKDKNGDFIERVNLSNARTFTTGANAYYVFFYLYKNGTTFDTGGYVQLEYGSTATEYEPYQTPQEYEINLGTIKLNKIGDYQDQIIGTPYNWSIKRQIGKYVANNDLGANGTTDAKVDLITPELNITPSLSGDSLSLITYCNLMPTRTPSGVITGLNGTTSASKIRVSLSKQYCSDYATATAFLTNNNFEIDYVQKDETTEPITNTELIEDLNNFYNAKSYNGQTNISVDGDLPMILDVSAIIDE